MFADAGYHGASIHAIIERAADRARHVLPVLRVEGGGVRLDPRRRRSPICAPASTASRSTIRARRRRRSSCASRWSPTLEYIVQDRPLATLLLSAGHTPDVEAAERLEQFYAEVRDLLRRALESGLEIGLLRKCHPELVAAAMLGMIRGVIEQLVRQHNELTVEDVVNEMLMVALRGVLA